MKVDDNLVNILYATNRVSIYNVILKNLPMSDKGQGQGHQSEQNIICLNNFVTVRHKDIGISALDSSKCYQHE